MTDSPRWRLGSMCSGYGGLDLAAAAVLGELEHVWHCEIDPDASTVLATRWPGVPNLVDLRTADWAAAAPVDILTAGFPCQPVSAAGKRAGTDDERWLFDDIVSALSRMVTRPRLLLFENVPGLLSANGGNAMAQVVHGLATLGYVGSYRVLRASDVGAPHRRERVFIVAHRADAPLIKPEQAESLPCSGHPGGAAAAGALSLLPTPLARLGEGRGQPNTETAARRMGEEGRRNLDDAVALLPTPASRDYKGADTRNDYRAADGTMRGPGQYTLPRAVMELLPTPQASDGGGGPQNIDVDGHGPGPRLRDVVPLLPTPRASDGTKGSPNQHGSAGDLILTSAVLQLVIQLGADELLLPTPMATDAESGRNATATRRTPPKEATNHSGWTLSDVAYADRWGEYGPAIARWEHVVGRSAPEPTELGTKGQPRLSPAFVEWMMGLPAGWVTNAGVRRNPSLRILGNGVVWRQGAAAIADLLADDLADVGGGRR